MVKTQLLQYCMTDNSLYRGLGGHTKLELKDVFNFQNTDNPHRIEELPEDVEGEVARDIPSRILQSMLPSGCPSLLLWKETLRVAAVQCVPRHASLVRRMHFGIQRWSRTS